MKSVKSNSLYQSSKMGNFEILTPLPHPAQILHAIRYFGGMSQNALCSGCYFIVVVVTPIVSWWQKTSYLTQKLL